MKEIIPLVAVTLFSSQTLAEDIIRFATEATYPPFEYMDENNEFQGFDIDLARAVCKAIDAKCDFNNQSFDSLIPALKFRRYDAAISGLDITPERAASVDFTQVYYENSAIFVSAKGEFKSVSDLQGKAVAVQNGSSHQKYVIDKLSGKGVFTVPHASYQNAFLDMSNGRVDAVFADTAVAVQWLNDHGEGKFATVGQPITDKNYFGTGFGIAVNKGNKELLDKLNKGLKLIRENGEYDVIYSKYFPK